MEDVDEVCDRQHACERKKEFIFDIVFVAFQRHVHLFIEPFTHFGVGSLSPPRVSPFKSARLTHKSLQLAVP